ncbi:MAG TPA: TIGR03118 family protein [Gemmataceae bacterium]|nr:TIGR03118 family protein [Gemmataceae bacterium]
MNMVNRRKGWAGRLSLRTLPWLRDIGLAKSDHKPRLTSRSSPHLEPLEDRLVLAAAAVLDPNLGLRTVVSGLVSPTAMAFLGDNDFLVLEKTTGKIDHIVNGIDAATKFDFGSGPISNLPVNSNSERGLLGMALSPNFTNDHNVYLYWTESSTGAVSNNVADVPVLGNRVDRFIWNAVTSTFTFDRNIIQLHAFQNDGNGGNPNQMQGNHNGGVIHFGPDGKLYIVIGDNGRRGWMQNLINGPNGPGQTDENNGPVRGGPAPDDAHLTGVLLRLNPDGSIPEDNPFVDIRTTLQAPLLSGAGTSALGSFTAFLNQAMDTFTAHVNFQGLPAPAIAAQVRLGGPDGPVLFNVSNLPQGLTSADLTTTLTAANFVAEPPNGIFTLADAVNAVVAGRANFTIYTSQLPGGEISGAVAQLDPEITNNLHRVFAYGIRNTFGYTWDPITGKLWMEENGDLSFDKISIVGPGANDGWIQSSAPLLNIDGTLDDVALAEFKSIELRLNPNGLQQTRWPSANIADSAQAALDRLVMLPGAYYNPPVFSVRAEDPPAALSFYTGSALGPQYQNLLFEGEARDKATDPREQFDGALFAYHLTPDRNQLDFGNDPNVRASDHVFLNNTDFDLMGDTSFLFGTGFGIATDIVTGPDGNMYVVSETKGNVYEIFNKASVGPMQAANLVSDLANPPGGAPQLVDPNLKNPWGVARSATSPFWVANEGSGTSTLYSGDLNGGPVTKSSTVAVIPPAPGRSQGTPTGVVNNSTTDFVVNGAPARWIFSTLDGTIAGWNGGSDAQQAAVTQGAVYTGLAIGSTASGNFLYAANASQGRIDVFDKNFAPVSAVPGAFTFTDPNLPLGLTPYRPFNIQDLNGTLYVTYRNSADPEHGGIVDAFDTNGNFLRRIVSSGVNAPWGLAIAPTGFGPFSGALLVGNFGLGDGKINAFDLNTGTFLGYITDATGNPLTFEGLWGLAFGNGGSGGDPRALYFAAGIDRVGAGSLSAADGLFGSIRLIPAPGQTLLPTALLDLAAVMILNTGGPTQPIRGGFKPPAPGMSSPNHRADSAPLVDAVLQSPAAPQPLDGQALHRIGGADSGDDPLAMVFSSPLEPW